MRRAYLYLIYLSTLITPACVSVPVDSQHTARESPAAIDADSLRVLFYSQHVLEGEQPVDVYVLRIFNGYADTVDVEHDITGHLSPEDVEAQIRDKNKAQWLIPNLVVGIPLGAIAAIFSFAGSTSDEDDSEVDNEILRPLYLPGALLLGSLLAELGVMSLQDDNLQTGFATFVNPYDTEGRIPQSLAPHTESRYMFFLKRRTPLSQPITLVFLFSNRDPLEMTLYPYSALPPLVQKPIDKNPK
jgi:hypothetical protein